jgi:uncharacterized protein YhhL (DUF1145 family)
MLGLVFWDVMLLSVVLPYPLQTQVLILYPLYIRQVEVPIIHVPFGCLPRQKQNMYQLKQF